jgi:hypothetical protein
LIQTLEERLRDAAHQPSSEELAKQASTAAQIDNETLREQVAHFQQRIQHLEDQLEEAQAAAEREEAAVKTRLTRYKEKDTQRQQELEEARQLAATAAKSETTAKTRIEELEEALRENTAALEDARAEIEALRTDLTVSYFVLPRNYVTSEHYRSLRILPRQPGAVSKVQQLIHMPRRRNTSRHCLTLLNSRLGPLLINWPPPNHRLKSRLGWSKICVTLLRVWRKKKQM